MLYYILGAISLKCVCFASTQQEHTLTHSHFGHTHRWGKIDTFLMGGLEKATETLRYVAVRPGGTTRNVATLCNNPTHTHSKCGRGYVASGSGRKRVFRAIRVRFRVCF